MFRGQVTIPKHIREKLNIGPNTEIEFVEEEEKVYLLVRPSNFNPFNALRGIATVKMTTDEILTMTRGE